MTTTEILSKSCAKCDKEFPATTDFFYSAQGYLRSFCIACDKERSIANYKVRGISEESKTLQKIYLKSSKGIFAHYKASAKERGYSFDLAFDEFMTFWQKPCFYCSDQIETIGLDRINSSLDYRLDNLVACCTVCNLMKLDTDQTLFINKIKQIAGRF